MKSCLTEISRVKTKKAIQYKIKNIKRENETLERKIESLRTELNCFKLLLQLYTEVNAQSENNGQT